MPTAREAAVVCEGTEALAGERPVEALRADVGAYAAVLLEHRSARADGARAPLGLLAAILRTPRRFTPVHRATAGGLASIAELAIATSRLHRRTLGHLAEAGLLAAVDPLTGLANHRLFHERLREEARRAHRRGRPLAVAMFDIDTSRTSTTGWATRRATRCRARSAAGCATRPARATRGAHRRRGVRVAAARERPARRLAGLRAGP